LPKKKEKEMNHFIMKCNKIVNLIFFIICASKIYASTNVTEDHPLELRIFEGKTVEGYDVSLILEKTYGALLLSDHLKRLIILDFQYEEKNNEVSLTYEPSSFEPSVINDKRFLKPPLFSCAKQYFDLKEYVRVPLARNLISEYAHNGQLGRIIGENAFVFSLSEFRFPGQKGILSLSEPLTRVFSIEDSSLLPNVKCEEWLNLFPLLPPYAFSPSKLILAPTLIYEDQRAQDGFVFGLFLGAYGYGGLIIKREQEIYSFQFNYRIKDNVHVSITFPYTPKQASLFANLGFWDHPLMQCGNQFYDLAEVKRAPLPETLLRDNLKGDYLGHISGGGQFVLNHMNLQLPGLKTPFSLRSSLTLRNYFSDQPSVFKNLDCKQWKAICPLDPYFNFKKEK
jgi:hypothetical protein